MVCAQDKLSNQEKKKKRSGEIGESGFEIEIEIDVVLVVVMWQVCGSCGSQCGYVVS